ncbi:oxygen-dependent choline dehydrogenase [Rhypophila decipiens]|uniref:Oxygen-dependent choline dehydrogenase n=1 Tax=Rhypophila decipiens TaxID=261697 RepID=A0AAN6Y6J7_9PEZI|nr:oxygen-dependent choline dehydrogenase [Rhypophila decipiens]
MRSFQVITTAATVLTSLVLHCEAHRALSATIITRATKLLPSYDYVIVGGGTAGLTVADRLTEDGKTTVLVIEYGPNIMPNSIKTISGGFGGMSSGYLYDIQSVPQVNLQNRTTAVQAGKIVGGSSAVNALMTVRGTTEDYDRWGSFFSGSSDWSWQGLLPYFRKALNFVPPNADVAASARMTYNTSYWGTTSGVYAAWPSFQYPGTTLIMEAFKGLPGVEFPGDSGSGKPGVYWYPQFMDPKKVERSYAKTGHLDNQNRSNYHLIADSRVTKILLNGTTATGVTFIPANSKLLTNTTTVVASKEVILAAGGIHSPHILQLSGIGPKKILTAAKIDTIVDLPGVGQNFQDHPMLQATYQYRNLSAKPSPDDMFMNATFASWAQNVWRTNKTGPNSIATGNAAAWLPFPVISTRASTISSQLLAQNHSAYLPADTDPTVAAGYAAQMRALASALNGNNTAFFNFVITGGSTSGILIDLHPLSRGTVNVDPRDPYGRVPMVDYRALSNPMDVTIMTEIHRYARKFHFENPLTATWRTTEVVPGTSVQSDKDWEEYIIESLSPSEFHPVGTCAMMPRELGGVVDEQLRVYGTKNLRVVDASVMPTLPGGNTCQTVYAIAEKAADIIRSGAGTKARATVLA